ncbi:MAG TPA: threonine ammonia-lyase [Candidatus Eisenbacteria bacterium]|nr:threonine ammonia-lyase [Candidatus Eisenbacteria bacterium]
MSQINQSKLTLDNVYRAAHKIKEVVRKTDMIRAEAILPHDMVYLKTENLQTTGSFKIRGAYYKISQLSSEQRAKGVVACSAGNHAQGVALACNQLGIQSTIFMAESAPISKIEATRQYGSKVVLAGDNYDDTYEAALKYIEKHDKVFIHPFDDEEVIAGQGTIALEILDQLPDVDMILLPVGGGGLLAGVAYVIKSLKPECKIIGVETEKAPSMSVSLKKNKIVKIANENTFSDGIAVKQPGPKTFELAKKYVDQMITVSEDEIAFALLSLMEKQKLVCEGAGSVAFAALLFEKVPIKNKKVCAVLTGGNIDVSILSRVIQRGLLVSGRNTELSIGLTDKPGQLQTVAGLIAEMGANVTEVVYNPGGENTAIDSCVLNLKLETKNIEHIQQIKDRLSKAGFSLIDKEKLICKQD